MADASVPPLERIASAQLPTAEATFTMTVFRAEDGKEHMVLSLGDLKAEPPPLVRIHSECLTGDALGSMRCDCGPQLQEAMHRIAAEGRGAILYLRQEGRGIGLGNKIRAYALQDQGVDTVDANHQLGFPDDARDYRLAVALLCEMGVCRLRLLTNNPRKVASLAADGIEVVDRVPLQVGENPHNAGYLATKRKRLGHLLPP
ncbi:GTP cyclohydrolase II [Stagnimonas aquatica]|uniref:GTP cyclohydrolase II n=1 Tax=Stagnimonas aquatica TaxID=2689987 RepID=UPI001F01B7B4|nr:GTP cyclohydrolase II [Stagnimonas aquatica]